MLVGLWNSWLILPCDNVGPDERLYAYTTRSMEYSREDPVNDRGTKR